MKNTHADRMEAIRQVEELLVEFRTQDIGWDPTPTLHEIRRILGEVEVSAPPAGDLRIVAVAHDLGGGMILTSPPPSRHHNLLRWLHDAGISQRGPSYQGFLTSNGRYVDRKTAAAIATTNGRVAGLNAPPDLYSEDLF